MRLVLIGMPGCGKTTIGGLAAKRLGTELVDLDERIVKKSGMSINDIFAENGEEYFRQLETEALRDSLRLVSAVISTGGGIVKYSRNIDLIREMGGYTVFIDRPLELILGDIDTSERPLLKDGAERLRNLYAQRYELYKAAADSIVVNDKGIDDIVREVCEIFKTEI